MKITEGNEKLIKVLDGASEKLRSLLEMQGRPEGALRIAVVGGGCSGLQYQMDLVDEPKNRDIRVRTNDVAVVIDPESQNRTPFVFGNWFYSKRQNTFTFAMCFVSFFGVGN